MIAVGRVQGINRSVRAVLPPLPNFFNGKSRQQSEQKLQSDGRCRKQSCNAQGAEKARVRYQARKIIQAGELRLESGFQIEMGEAQTDSPADRVYKNKQHKSRCRCEPESGFHACGKAVHGFPLAIL